MNELLNRLEGLRIPDSEFFNIPEEKQYAYSKANDMLDDCLQMVYDYFMENDI